MDVCLYQKANKTKNTLIGTEFGESGARLEVTGSILGCGPSAGDITHTW